MPIHEIIVNDHKIQYGQSSSDHRKWKEVIRNTIRQELEGHVELDIVDVYNLNKEFTNYNTGSRGRCLIFSNATRVGASEENLVLDAPLLINSIENNHKEFLQPLGSGVVIMSENGAPLAEYHKDKNQLFILFNIFNEYNSANHKILRFIMKEWVRLYWSRLALENSWVHTSDKAGLTARFTERVRAQQQSQLEGDKDQERRYASSIEDYKRKIKQYYDNMIRLRQQIALAEENANTAGEKLIKDLDLIVAHEKISDLHIKDGKFIIYVPKVYAYDEKEARYYIGNCRVEIQLENADVKFYGDNPRRSYWSGQDPHPHIDGTRGRACLGNVSSTIAELCSRNEIYALALVCIDFLESVNTSDPAGKNIVNWDRVDEEGNVIRNGGEVDFDEDDDEYVICDDCGERVHMGDITTAYESVDDDNDAIGERTVCNNCLEDVYTFNDSVDEYIRD